MQKTPFSFDVSVWEFFWPLMSGARLVVAAPGDHRDPAKLVKLINREGVDTLHFVPSMLQAFLQDEGVVSCTSLKRIVCSGEALPADAQQQVFAKLPQAGLYNLYGRTAEAGATVILTDGNGNPIGQVTADGSGNWAFTPATPLANGTVINALAQDAAGNNSSPTSATVDSLAPAAPVIDPSNGSVIAGTAEAGATVILTDGNGNPIGQVTAERALEAQAHQDLPFEQLVEALQPERSLSHNPLFQVLFNYQSEARGNGQAFRFDELQMESVQFDSRTAQFDLTLDLTDEEQRFCAVFDYATDLFDASTVERLAGHWRNLRLRWRR